MSVNWGVDVTDTKKWFVGAHTIYGEPRKYPGTDTPAHGEVVIPVCQLDGLTIEEIGQTVLKLIPLANACYAQNIADNYRECGGVDWQSYYRGTDGEHLKRMIYEDLPLLERYLDNKHVNQSEILEVVIYLRAAKERYERRAMKISRKAAPARAVINKDYNSTFMRIGRRDGFHCGACSATKDLQIDHVVPVVNGGEGEDNNLQLLCGSCNRAKGTNTVDYRSTKTPKEVEAVQ